MRSVYALRRAIVARQRARIVVWWAGLLAVPAGVLLATKGVWTGAVSLLVVAAALTWLVGAWVLPATRDAYIRRVARILRELAADTQLAYGRFDNRQAKFAERVASLVAPQELVAEHDRLVRHLHAYEQLRRQPWSPSLAREATEAWRTITDVKNDLCCSPGSEEQRAYAAALDRLFTNHRHDYATAAATSERANIDAVRNLARAKPPASVANEHQALTASLNGLLEVARELYEASEAANPERAGEAAIRWQTSVTQIRAEVRRIADRLDVYERWPAPAAQRPSGD